MPVLRNNEKLWNQIKSELLKKNDNHWSARLAQIAVQEYKRRGGTYSGAKPTAKDNSLVKWSKESWGYALDDPSGRYLPKAVREQASKKLLLKKY
jgi:hypothetical protein